MPKIYRFGCNKCDFKLPGGWGGIMYVSDNGGNRIICPHPGEMFTAYSVNFLAMAAIKVRQAGAPSIGISGGYFTYFLL